LKKRRKTKNFLAIMKTVITNTIVAGDCKKKCRPIYEIRINVLLMYRIDCLIMVNVDISSSLKCFLNL